MPLLSADGCLCMCCRGSNRHVRMNNFMRRLIQAHGCLAEQNRDCSSEREGDTRHGCEDDYHVCVLFISTISTRFKFNLFYFFCNPVRCIVMICSGANLLFLVTYVVVHSAGYLFQMFWRMFVYNVVCFVQFFRFLERLFSQLNPSRHNFTAQLFLFHVIRLRRKFRGVQCTQLNLTATVTIVLFVRENKMQHCILDKYILNQLSIKDFVLNPRYCLEIKRS